MPKKEFFSVSDVLKIIVQKYKLTQVIEPMRVCQAWEKVTNGKYKNYIQKIQYKDKVLQVFLKSSVLRQELLYRKSELISLINRELSSEEVNDLVIR